MNARPLIVRELRVEARNQAIYRLRMVGTAWLLAILWLGWPADGLDPGAAARLFSSISLGLFATIWLVAPMIASDSLSRERREGTLGLLFLTPLTALDVVTGKGLAHALRAASLVVAALPILVVPTLLGGVGWMDLTRALCLNLAALVLAIAAGVVASAWCRDWRWALALATALSAGASLLCFSAYATGRILVTFQVLGDVLSWGRFTVYFGHYWQERVARLPFWDLHGWLAPGNTPTITLPTARADLTAVWLAGGLLALAVVAAMGAVMVAARHVRESWMDRPLSPAQLQRHRVFFTPRYWLDLMRKKRQRTLERNPVGWLAQYSWQARLVKWGWVLAVAIMEFWFRAGSVYWQTVLNRHEQMAGLLLLTLAANSAITFHAERRTGAFELLLVSPLRPEQIAWGRLRGLVAQALPAGTLLAVCWTDYWPGRYFGDFDFVDPAVLETLLSLSTMVTLPAVGLFCSLRWQSPLLAWLATCAAGILPTLAGAWLIEHSSWRERGPVAIAATMVMVLATQMLAATMCLRRVIRALARRDFAGPTI